jgi:hypothetical protein
MKVVLPTVVDLANAIIEVSITGIKISYAKYSLDLKNQRKLIEPKDNLIIHLSTEIKI